MANKIEKETPRHFGEHFMIDGYGGERKLLDDCEYLLSLLNRLPCEVGMKKLADPVIYSAPGNDKKDPGGWSGFVVIAESHISIHTFPDRGFVSIDVYTCKNGMDTNKIQTFFINAFSLKEVEVNFVLRGKRYLNL